MKVISLEIRRALSYEENAGQLYGVISLAGTEGKQFITLRPGTISRIMTVCREQILCFVNTNVRQTDAAMEAAITEPLDREAS